MTSVGWIDFSSEHRDKVRMVLDLLKKKGVLDELGIGGIRDTFSDQLFPGISTIQTRAKYFIITTFLLREYLQFPQAKRKSRPLDRFLKRREREIRAGLVEKHQDDSRNRGIIGNTFGTDRNRGVIRRPSSVYWNGLVTFGMVRPRISLAEFERRAIKSGDILSANAGGTAKERGDEGDHSDLSLPRILTPPEGEDYWDNLDIDLTQEEAVFLRDQITSTQPRSLLAIILMNPDAIEQLRSIENGSFEDFCDLPFISQISDQKVTETLFQARDFWRFLRGAHILYDCMLQKRFGTEELLDKCEEEWASWCKSMKDFPINWQTDELWQRCSDGGRKIQPATRNFVSRWIVEAGQPTIDRTACEELVRLQEMTNKGTRARLKKSTDELRIEDPMGIRILDYRLTQGRRIVLDIVDAEQGAGNA